MVWPVAAIGRSDQVEQRVELPKMARSDPSHNAQPSGGKFPAKTLSRRRMACPILNASLVRSGAVPLHVEVAGSVARADDGESEPLVEPARARRWSTRR